MGLALNVKQYRKDHFISQEYMAEKLCMCQPNYSRIENCDAACAKRLSKIADALDTTPEVLQQYHLVKELDSSSELNGSVEVPLVGEDVIQSQEAYIEFLNLFIKYTQAVWQKYLSGGFVGG